MFVDKWRNGHPRLLRRTMAMKPKKNKDLFLGAGVLFVFGGKE
jgi:hypothetical protein